MDEWWLYSMTRGFVRVHTEIGFNPKGEECIDLSYKDPFGKTFTTWQLPKERAKYNFGLDKFTSLKAAVYHEVLVNLQLSKMYRDSKSYSASWKCTKQALRFIIGYSLTKIGINATKVWRLGSDEVGNISRRRWWRS